MEQWKRGRGGVGSVGGAYSRWKGHTGGMGQCGRGIQERWGSMGGAYKRDGVVWENTTGEGHSPASVVRDWAKPFLPEEADHFMVALLLSSVKTCLSMLVLVMSSLSQLGTQVLHSL